MTTHTATMGLYGHDSDEAERFRRDIEAAAEVLIRRGQRVNYSTLATMLPMERTSIRKFSDRFDIDVRQLGSTLLRRFLSTC